jgi:hypothetical protein
MSRYRRQKQQERRRQEQLRARSIASTVTNDTLPSVLPPAPPASPVPATAEEAAARVLVLAARPPESWQAPDGTVHQYPQCVVCDGPVFDGDDDRPDGWTFRGTHVPICGDCDQNEWRDDYDLGRADRREYMLDAQGNLVLEPEFEEDDDADDEKWALEGVGLMTTVYLYGNGFALVASDEGDAGVIYAVLPAPPRNSGRFEYDDEYKGDD